MPLINALNLTYHKDKKDKNDIRVNQQEKQWFYYIGDSTEVKQYLTTALAITYDTEDIAEMQLQWINLVEKVITQLAVVYRQPAIREIRVKDVANEELTKYYLSIMPLDLNNSDKMAHRLAKLHNTSITHVIYNEKRKRFQFRVLPSYLYDIEHDLELLTQISYKKFFKDSGEELEYTVVWTDDELYRVDAFSNRSALPNKKDELNPWGVLPFPVLPLKEDVTFWGEGQNDLVNVNEQVNFLLTKVFNSDIILGTEGTTVATNLGLTFKGEEDAGIKKVRTGRKHPLVAENVRTDMHPPNLTHVTTDPHIIEIRDFIDWYIKIEATLKGLPASKVLSETKDTSDYQKLMDMVDEMEIRADDIEPCRVYEKERFDVVRTINNKLIGTTEGKGLKEIPEDAELIVDFIDIEIQMTPEDKRKQREFESKHGLSTPVDWLMEDNKELKREEAEKEIQENKTNLLSGQSRFANLVQTEGNLNE